MVEFKPMKKPMRSNQDRSDGDQLGLTDAEGSNYHRTVNSLLYIAISTCLYLCTGQSILGMNAELPLRGNVIAVK